MVGGTAPSVGMDAVSSEVVDSPHLVELRERLKSGLPGTNSMRICIRNVLERRVLGRFYVDEWPCFTTVVFQCLQPRLSDTADLFCYSTSKHRLLHVLEQNRLVSMGKWQQILTVEDDGKSIADYVVENLQLDGEYSLASQDYYVEEVGMYALLDELKIPKEPCREGYSIGTLTEETSHFAASQGQWFNKIGRPPDAVQEYHKQCVLRLDTVAIHQGEGTTPVAWRIQWAYDGNIGNIFTLPTHRRRGLATLVLIESCKAILARNEMPEIHAYDGNPSIDMCLKIGFSCIGRLRSICLHFNNNSWVQYLIRPRSCMGYLMITRTLL